MLDAPARSALDVTAAFTDHGAFIFRCALHWGLAGDDADDLVQEVFVVAYRRRHDFDPDGSARAWLYGIARRIASRHHRAHRRRRALSDALEAEPGLAVADDGLENSLAWREAAAELATFLGALPEPQREAFVLCELEELSAREVGEALGVSSNTVSSRLRLARGEFQRHVHRLEAQRAGFERALRRAARPTPAPERRERHWSAIVAASPGLAVATGGGALGGVSAGLAMALKGFGLAVVTSAGLVGVGAWAVASPGETPHLRSETSAMRVSAGRASPSPASPSATPPPSVTDPESDENAAPTDTPKGRVPRFSDPVDDPPRGSNRSPAPIADADADADATLRAEVELGKQIAAARKRGDHRQVLTLSRQHADRFPRGKLREVTEHARFDALCGLGEAAEAVAAARASNLPALRRRAAHGCD